MKYLNTGVGNGIYQAQRNTDLVDVARFACNTL